MKVDLHMHSSFSDGSDTIDELLKKIKENKIEIFALTDHDTIDGLEYINSPYIKGIEFSTISSLKEEHILGYDFNENDIHFINILNKGKMLRHQKLLKRLEGLKRKYHIIFNKEDEEYLMNLKVCTKPHIAKMLMKYGYGNSISESIEKYINHVDEGNDRISYIEAIESIKKAGGIAIWAHPLGGENEKHLSKDVFLKEFEKMKEAHIDGLECYYSRYTIKECEFLVNLCKENDLLISGGSDYHGKNKDINMGCLNSDNQYIDSKMLTVLEKCKNTQ